MKKNGLIKAVGGVALLTGAALALKKVVTEKVEESKNKARMAERDARTNGQLVYKAVADSREITVCEPDIEGLDLESTMSNIKIDMSNQVFSEDSYIGISSYMSNVKFIMPGGINVKTDISSTMSNISNSIVNEVKEDVVTVYIIGTARMSSIEMTN